MSNYLNNLNSAQKQAVEATDGALLVLAGAGTGKTSVLTAKIAHILESGLCYPFEIMAVTFTNKAAKEMKHRIHNFAGDKAEGVFIGTFHSLSLKILRFNAQKVGLKQSFNIIDEDEQITVLKNLIESMGLDVKVVAPKLVAYQINSWKDKALNPNDVQNNNEFLEIYKRYEDELKKLNAIDFGGLILQVINLLKNNLDVAQLYQNRFKYILVDEYQDTNVAQYLWLKLFATKENSNICCVGDDDQSIYGWRGAEIQNILRFTKDYDGAQIIRLEQNYRSTQNILDCANNIISVNENRLGKNLKSNTTSNDKVKVHSFWDDKEEARFIAKTISGISNIKKQEIAILVRAGHQTRVLEEALLSNHIPYKIIGGQRFYDRLEIKDATSYIKLLVDSDNNLAFERVINTPKRGLGKASIDKIKEVATAKGVSNFLALKQMAENKEFGKKILDEVQKFLNTFADLKKDLEKESHVMVVRKMLEDTGYIKMWKDEKTEEAFARVENVNELIKALGEFENLAEFLDHISLISDVDNMNEADMVNIITIHSAKGLEFNTVFLPGWEEGLFPSDRSIVELGQKGLEEERRLAYVAITRAKRNLHISFAANRFIYGSFISVIPSRFISELPKENIEQIASGSKNAFASHYKPDVKKQIYRFDVDGQRINQPQASSPSKFAQNKKVFHQKFGYGRVLEAKDAKITVKFEDGSIKTLISDFLSVANF